MAWCGIQLSAATLDPSPHQLLERHRPRTWQPSLSLPNPTQHLVPLYNQRKCGVQADHHICAYCLHVARCVCMCTRKDSAAGKYMMKLHKTKAWGAMDDAPPPPLLDTIIKKSELDMAMDNHLRSSLPVTMNTASAATYSPRTLTPRHEGPGSTSLHVMPPNPCLGASIEVETASPNPTPFITATHSRVLLL